MRFGCDQKPRKQLGKSEVQPIRGTSQIANAQSKKYYSKPENTKRIKCSKKIDHQICISGAKLAEKLLMVKLLITLHTVLPYHPQFALFHPGS